VSVEEQKAVHKFVWRNFAPPRVRFFGWLLVQNRIQSRDNLKKKTIVEDACCELCGEREETVDHIVSGCPFTASFWSRGSGDGSHCPC